jgi:2-keto-4-pentenoate hydratase
MLDPRQLLSHIDSGQLWPAGEANAGDLAAAYQRALAVRQLRIARGEQPRGYKVGFTNRGIWPLYGVDAPIWGTVWDTTLAFCDGHGELTLANTCQPRIEPEVAFGLRAEPAADCDLASLFEALEWMAPAFEIVQSHRPDWKFQVQDTAADSGLHARLLVGRKLPVREVAHDAVTLERKLAAAAVVLTHAGDAIDQGRGANVLDGPLHALLHFVRELRACPGAPALQAGDVITTGTWTNAWPVAPGQTWTARFDAPLPPLEVRFTPG